MYNPGHFDTKFKLLLLAHQLHAEQRKYEHSGFYITWLAGPILTLGYKSAVGAL